MSTNKKSRPIESLSYDPELGPDYFIQVPQTILKDTELSHGAFRLYCILLSYCRQKPTAWPGQDTLATDLNCNPRQIRNLLNELRTIGLIDWQQNGQSSNRYHVYKAPLKGRETSDRKNIATLDRKNIATLDRQLIATESHKLEQHKEEQHHGDDALKSLLTGQGFNPRTVDRLATILEKNSRSTEFITGWLDYIKADQGIKRPLGFLRVMIEENQTAPQTEAQKQASAQNAKMEKWLKRFGGKE